MPTDALQTSTETPFLDRQPIAIHPLSRTRRGQMVLRHHCSGCLVPRFNGALLSREWKEARWDKFVTGAPRTVTRQHVQSMCERACSPSELQYSDPLADRVMRSMIPRSDDRRNPASYAAAAGRLPLCPSAIDTASDAVSVASMLAAAWHLPSARNRGPLSGHCGAMPCRAVDKPGRQKFKRYPIHCPAVHVHMRERGLLSH